MSLDSLLYKSSSDNFILDLKAFFERPIIVQQGTMTGTDTVSSFAPMVAPNDFIYPYTLRLNKLQGFFGFRATCVLRLVVNASRFQQGRYMLTYTSTGGTNPTTAPGLAWYTSHIVSLTQRSMLPRVEIDLGTETEATLRIPYSSCANFVPVSAINNNTYDFNTGVFTLFPYSRIPTAAGTCTYTIWHHFEDVELIGTAIPQSGRMFTKTASDKEQASVGAKPLSSALSVASTSMGILSTIPLLTAYAAPASWVLDRMAGVASLFGWCKPTNLEKSSKTSRKVLPYLGNVDSVDNSSPLSLSLSNQVSNTVFAGTNIDEMDFDFFYQLYAYYSFFNWTSARAPGYELTSFRLAPKAFPRSVTTLDPNGGIIYQPMNLMSLYFQYWRGSIKVKFKLAKTEFHSGRIAVCFTPNEPSSTATTATYASSDYLHREIIDIRGINEFEVSFPFVSSSPYKPVNDADDYIGYVHIFVVEQLVSPSTVTDSVVAIMEVAGGEDFEYAVPLPLTQTTVLHGVTPQSGKMFAPNSNPESALKNSVGASSTKQTIQNAAFCIGERITSFRTLLKQSVALRQETAGANGDFIASIVPFGYDVGTDANPLVKPTVSMDLYGFLCSMYALSRGGVRLKFPPLTGTTNMAMEKCYYRDIPATGGLGNIFSSQSAADSSGVAVTQYTGGARVMASSWVGDVMEVYVPQYHRFHSRANPSHICGTGGTYDIAALGLATRGYVIYDTTGSPSNPHAVVHRGGGDDCTFGDFVSIPIFGASTQYTASL